MDLLVFCNFVGANYGFIHICAGSQRIYALSVPKKGNWTVIGNLEL